MKNKKNRAFFMTICALLLITSVEGYLSKKRKKTLRSMYTSDLQDQVREARDRCYTAPWSRKQKECDRYEALQDELNSRNN